MTDGYKLVSGGDDIKLWKWPELKLLYSLKPHSNAVTSLAWSPNNNYLASTAVDNTIVVTSFTKSAPASIELEGCENDTCLGFNATSRHLVTAGRDKIINIWDLKTRTIKKKIKGPSDAISCVTFNWNDTSVAVGTTKGDIVLNSLSTSLTSMPMRLLNTQVLSTITFSDSLRHSIFTIQKSLLGSVSDDGALNIWDTNTKKISCSFHDGHAAPAMDLSFSPMNDMLLATVGLDKRIVFYDILGKKIIKEMQIESPLTSISFMHDGATFAVGTTRGKISLYDLRSGSTPLSSTMAHKSLVQCVSFQLPPKSSSSSSSSATLAAKLVSRSATNVGDKKETTASLVQSIAGKPKIVQSSAHNENQHTEENDLFSPLRDGTYASTVKLVETNRDADEKMNANISDYKTGASSSKIFSPVNNETDSYHLPLQRSDSTPNLNDVTISSTSKDIPYVTRQPWAVSNIASNSGDLPPEASKTEKTRRGALKLGRNRPSLGRRAVSSTELKVSRQASELGTTQKMADISLTSGKEVLNGQISPTPKNNEKLPGFHEYQIKFVKNLIEDSMDEFRMNFHQDVVNLQVEMLRQFQIQQNEMKTLLQQHSSNDALVAENERLREEIKRLKSTH
ncbi:protein NEDD1-like [Xenia sp. Carnegie-2017]|uniref:protein NEDD1-like n=1 Tax=Xenia sp. Carnegie-2017 TaxID=2897299 RepID=UPI001F0331A3|nr:protein NEDD1-like [Xenia sp. Carnegie-2017]